MKLLLIGLFALLMGIPSQSENGSTLKKESQPKLKTYYFHGERRCFTCNSIEKHTKTTMEKYFAEEIKNGTITFEVINIDKPENKGIAKKFKVYSSSLIVEKKVKAGYEKINLTNFAFMYGKNKEKYITELKKKIEGLLK